MQLWLLSLFGLLGPPGRWPLAVSAAPAVLVPAPASLMFEVLASRVASLKSMRSPMKHKMH